MRALIPQPVVTILETLERAGFEAFIVGGCLRDSLLGREPKDWDVTTNAQPKEIQKLFPDSVYENDFGTVGVKVEGLSPKPRAIVEGSPGVPVDHVVPEAGTAPQKSSAEDTPPNKEGKAIVEVTTYRVESGYSDQRRPDQVTFVTSLEEDLARRDFTVNAMAAKVVTSTGGAGIGKNDETNPGHKLPVRSTAAQKTFALEIIDLFGGQADLKGKVFRTVGNPEERFGEDALRMLRAVRFLTELGKQRPDGSVDWHIEVGTLAALKKLSGNLARISIERIRDEFSKILLSSNPSMGVTLLQTTGLLRHFLPELEEGIGVSQNLHHIYTVWEHNLRALETCPSPKLSVRLAALLHDVAKPRTKRGEGKYSTFYNHDHVGARMTEKILTRLRYPKKIIEHATLLVDQHLFYYNVGEVTATSVRRLIRRVGLENMDDLMAVRIGDRLGSGVPKGKPYKLRHLEYMIEKVSHDPTSVKMLKVDGRMLMEKLNLLPGPKIGALLDCLLAEVIENPERNTEAALLDRARALMDNDLDALRMLAQERIAEERASEDQTIKGRHHVS